MVSSAYHGLEVIWSDFPKGLRVLLLDEDEISAAETKLKLEAINYIVFSYHNEHEAMEAIHNKAENFHVAIVEVSSSDSQRSLRFLEMVKDLPAIAISDVHCLSTMMKCSELGAAEFLQKPLSEEKLRNLWQHVVHRAFNAGGNGLSKSLQPIKGTVVSMLQLRSDTTELRIDVPNDPQPIEKDHEERKHDDDSEENHKFPAPSTPQLFRGGRLMNEGYCQEPQNCSKDKDLSDDAKYSDSINNATNNFPIVVNSGSTDVLISNRIEDAVDEEVTSDNGSKTDECSSVKHSSQPISNMPSQKNVESSAEDQKIRKPFHCNNKSTRRKIKVDWTPDLHRKFVQAVDQLGIDQAIPSKILELMNVEGLTRHNIASHLQKYRRNRRHILPKDDNQRLQQHKDSFFNLYIQKPVSGVPPPSQVYPFWGQPNDYTPVTQMCFPTWQLEAQAGRWSLPHQRSWSWKTHIGIHADAWGYPVVPPYSQFDIPSQNTFHSNIVDASDSRIKVTKEMNDNNLAEEVIDRVVKEAISKPWLPLPLGLKPPSIDSVLNELQRQGICSIPPASHLY